MSPVASAVSLEAAAPRIIAGTPRLSLRTLRVRVPSAVLCDHCPGRMNVVLAAVTYGHSSRVLVDRDKRVAPMVVLMTWSFRVLVMLRYVQCTLGCPCPRAHVIYWLSRCLQIRLITTSYSDICGYLLTHACTSLSLSKSCPGPQPLTPGEGCQRDNRYVDIG